MNRSQPLHVEERSRNRITHQVHRSRDDVVPDALLSGALGRGDKLAAVAIVEERDAELEFVVCA